MQKFLQILKISNYLRKCNRYAILQILNLQFQDDLRQYMERLKADRAAKKASIGALPNVAKVCKPAKIENLATFQQSTSPASVNVAALLSPSRPSPSISSQRENTPQPRLPPNSINSRLNNSIANNPGRQRSDDSLQRVKIVRVC